MEINITNGVLVPKSNYSANAVTVYTKVNIPLGEGKYSDKHVCIADLLNFIMQACIKYSSYLNEVPINDSNQYFKFDWNGVELRKLFDSQILITIDNEKIKELLSNRHTDVEVNDIVITKVVQTLPYKTLCSSYSEDFVTSIPLVLGYVLREGSVTFKLDSGVVRKFTVHNNYGKYFMTDNMVIRSTNCQFLHTFLVKSFSDPNDKNGFIISVKDLAYAIGVNYDDSLAWYNKDTKSFSKSLVKRTLEKYIQKINDCTCMTKHMGEIKMDIVRVNQQNPNSKILGFQIWLEDVK